MLDTTSLFLHVLAAIGVAAGGLLQIVAGSRVRSATSGRELADWVGFVRTGGMVTLVSAAVSLLTGGHLAGAVWGDHCSPISDTTILSSTGAGCNVITHVTTQLPYAVLAGAAALLFGTIPTSLGLPWWVGMLLAATVTALGLRLLGQPVEDYRPAGDA